MKILEDSFRKKGHYFTWRIDIRRTVGGSRNKREEMEPLLLRGVTSSSPRKLILLFFGSKIIITFQKDGQ
jgi:hypothetical protein